MVKTERSIHGRIVLPLPKGQERPPGPVAIAVEGVGPRQWMKR